MQFPSSIILALAASYSLVLAAPIGQGAELEMRDTLEQWNAVGESDIQTRDTLEQWNAEGSDLQAREPLFGLGSKKAPKVDYQQCCVNCTTQKTNCIGQGNSWGSCMTQYTACAHQCRAEMPK